MMRSIATDGITSVVPAVFRSAGVKSDSSHCLLIVTTAGSASHSGGAKPFCRPGLRGFPRSGPSDGDAHHVTGSWVWGRRKSFDACGKKVLWLVHLPDDRNGCVVVYVSESPFGGERGRSAAADRRIAAPSGAVAFTHRQVRSRIRRDRRNRRHNKQWHVVVTGTPPRTGENRENRTTSRNQKTTFFIFHHYRADLVIVMIKIKVKFFTFSKVRFMTAGVR